ncbi:MAG: hypothetical protein ACJ780_13350 [Solirubrobacteraceae bacterium]|jgi:hypothetical protein
MAWPGYFFFAGTEVINATRTERYARTFNVGWFNAVYNQDDLAWLLGEDDYTSPLQDDAPWTDPDNLDSYDFYGAYPLEITGLEDSTVDAEVVESVIDGGYVQKPRRKTRSVVFSAVLVGASECAVEYGLRWLRTVLNGGACFGAVYGNCGGAELCYLACSPAIGDEGEGALSCYSRVGRSLHGVTNITGPAVTKKLEMIDGGAAWTVTWTMVAADPTEFGVEKPLILGFLDPAVDVPYVGGEVPAGGSYDPDGYVQSDPACPAPIFTPVFDPSCDLLQPPPDLPSVVPMCFSFPVNYLRRSFVIPHDNIPLWTEVSPVVTLHTGVDEMRSVRLRFYADVFDTGTPNQDPCNYCGDVVFSYIPPGATLVLDCADRQVYIDQPGLGRRRADSLASASDGSPFDWPVFSCGFGYVVTVDTEQQLATPPIIDLSLVPRVA